MPRTTTPRVLTLALAAACTPAINGEIILNQYNGPNNYTYLVLDMPDFDQRRLGDLPGNGNCHCVPTSGTDLLAYASTHGFPSIAPGVPDYNSWESNLNYDAVTAIIDAVGIESQVGAGGTALCGTNFTKLADSIRPRVSSFFTVTIDYSATLSEIAQRGANSAAIGVIAYGRYDGTFDSSGTFYITNRSGGHAEAVNMVREYPGLRKIGLRNPAGSDSPTDTVQSSFKTEIFDVINQHVRFSDGTEKNKLRLGPTVNNNMRCLLLDGGLSIAPKAALTWNEYEPNTCGKHFPQMSQWYPAFTSPVYSELPFEITRLQSLPGSETLAIITDGMFKLIDPKTAEPLPLPEISPGPVSDLAVDRFSNIHLAMNDQVVIVNPSSQSSESLQMPGQVVAVAAASSWQQSRYSDAAPVAYALTSSPQMMVVIYQDEAGYDIERYTLQTQVPVALESTIVAMEESVFVLTNGHLESFRMDLGGGGFVPMNVGQPVSGIRNIVGDDNNVLLLAADNDTTYTAWQFSGDRFDAAEWHPLHEVETPGRLAVCRSNSNAIPWETEQYSLTEYDESDREAVSETVSDCRSDFNFDGTVDGADMGILLAEWSQNRSIADINRDGTVNGADLGLLLGAFGDCP